MSRLVLLTGESQSTALTAHLHKKALTSPTAQTDLDRLTNATTASNIIWDYADTSESDLQRRYELDRQSTAVAIYEKYVGQIKWQELHSSGQAAGTTEPAVEGVESDVAPPRKRATLTEDESKRDSKELFTETQ
ncbi:hypothetical protein IAU59_007079 [Kwoniella sp. CBS 9459]